MWIDVGVHLGRWPTRRVPHDDPAGLVTKLQAHAVRQAWAGNFEGLLHRDLAGVNARTAQWCAEHGAGILLPVGTIHPGLPDWEEDLRRCHETWQMRIIRVYPNYHQYGLDDPAFARLVTLCAERNLILQISVLMEDERTQHPLLHVPPVDTRPLLSLLKKGPRGTIVLLNALRSIVLTDLPMYTDAGEVYVEISNLEGIAGLERLLQHVSHERILFGSHFPFFQLESAILKLRESVLGGVQHEAIAHANAQRILEKLT